MATMGNASRFGTSAQLLYGQAVLEKFSLICFFWREDSTLGQMATSWMDREKLLGRATVVGKNVQVAELFDWGAT